MQTDENIPIWLLVFLLTLTLFVSLFLDFSNYCLLSAVFLRNNFHEQFVAYVSFSLQVRDKIDLELYFFLAKKTEFSSLESKSKQRKSNNNKTF